MRNEDPREKKRAAREREGRDMAELVQWAFATGRLALSQEEPALGEAIRDSRIQRKLRAADAARAVGVSVELWLQWEGDQQIPSEDELVRLVEVLKPEDAFPLFRRWRNAPRRLLALAVTPPAREARVARSADLGARSSLGSDARLTVRNLDPVLRSAVQSWCRRNGRPDDEDGLVALVAEVSTLPPVERERWVWQVNSCLGSPSR